MIKILFIFYKTIGHNQQKSLIEEKFILIEHPAYSPYLNPIENIFSIIKSNLSKKLKDRSILAKEDLWNLIKECADNISIQKIISVIRSMPDRLKKC